MIFTNRIIVIFIQFFITEIKSWIENRLCRRVAKWQKQVFDTFYRFLIPRIEDIDGISLYSLRLDWNQFASLLTDDLEICVCCIAFCGSSKNLDVKDVIEFIKG